MKIQLIERIASCLLKHGFGAKPHGVPAHETKSGLLAAALARWWLSASRFSRCFFPLNETFYLKQPARDYL